MSRFRRALKGLQKTYPSPAPERKAAFLKRMSSQQHSSRTIHLPLLHNSGRSLLYSIPAVVCATLIVVMSSSVFQKIEDKHIPTIPEETLASASSAAKQPTPSDSSNVVALPEVSATESPSFTQTIDPTEPESLPSSPLQTFPAADSSDPPQSIRTEDNNPTEQQESKQTEQEVTEQEATEQETVPIAQEPEPPVEEPIPTEGNHFEPAPSEDYDPFDLTVTPFNRYTLTQTVLEPEYDGVPGTEGNDSLSSTISGDYWKAMADASDDIVLCNVNELIYTSVGTDAYTQINVSTDIFYKMRYLFPISAISIYEDGGFLPLSMYLQTYPEYADRFEGYPGNTSVRMTGTTIHPTTKQDNIVMFLKYSKNPGIPGGAYEFTRSSDLSRFTLNGNTLTNTLTGITISLDELQAYIR